MSELATNTSIPDYGWNSGDAEASHDGATEVIEHLYAPRDFVRQAQRMLKPGGSYPTLKRLLGEFGFR